MKGSVRKRGSVWSYSFDLGIVDGKRKRKEKSGYRTKAECEKALRKAIDEFEDTGRIFKISDISLADYLDKWYTEYVLTECKYNTQKIYWYAIEKHIKLYFKDYMLKQLNPANLQKFLNDKMSSGLSKNYVNSMQAVLSGALKYAVYPCGYLKENPMTYVKMPKYKNEELEDIKIVTMEQFNKIIEKYPEGNPYYIILQLAFHTGMRGGEVVALMWDNVDLDNKTINVKHTLIKKGKGKFELGTPKTKTSCRTIPIGDTLLSILKRQKLWQKKNKLEYGEHYINSNFVCTKENGKPSTNNSIAHMSRIIKRDLKIDFSFHNLRHTHATMLIENGANFKVVQKRLGHSSLSTTMDIYAHVTKDMNLEAVNILESVIADK